MDDVWNSLRNALPLINHPAVNADTILKSRIEALDNPHVGSSLDSLLQETGELEEVAARTQKKAKRK